MTILYKEDFTKTGAIVDYTTKNDSFIRMSMVLKKMGVRNHNFCLALHDTTLQGVDPHSNDLTIVQKAKIIKECKINVWYFIREVVRIPVVGSEKGIRFVLNRGNLAFTWTFTNDIDIGWIQPRQTGKTYGVEVITAWMMFVVGFNLDIGMFTKDATLVQDNVARLKEIRDGLPKWMITKTPGDSDRKEGLYYAGLNNEYKTFTSANDENGAYKLGRKPQTLRPITVM